MDEGALLLDLFGRVPEEVHTAVHGLSAEQLATSPAPGANTIGWLTWHLTRVEDAHVAELLEQDQIWTTGDWAKRFGVEADPGNSGYGHSTEEMAAIRPDGPEAVLGYFDAVRARTQTYLEGLSAAELDRVIDENWDPPVTLGVRLISIVDDEIQHAGQAGYVRGLLERS